ncbi:FAD-dependent monooxygenase [Mycobacterium shigaense]|uniref:FAD-dependent monooxygenase n=1 Tax=Mycobacterium shigaense TaxID=722731 RepID=UPI001E4B465D|nr:FAD-dependent monooxygenase [Mycobacterium shigaense]
MPQGRHVHLMWGRGSSIIEGLFPGFVDGLLDAGAPYFDGDLSKVYFSAGGHPLPPSGRFDDFRFVLPSRPLLESHVRQHVRSVDSIEVRDGHDVVELAATGNRVSGVVIRGRGDGDDEIVEADLVVDAMGRGGRTPAFLQSLGYQRPAEDTLDVRLIYSSLPLRLPDGAIDELAVFIGPVPGRSTGMGLFHNENGVWMFTASAMAGQEAPTGFDEMVGFIKEFTPPHIVEAVRAGEVVGEAAQYRMPATRWRRYDKMQRWPRGLLVIGDAMCSFNPIYAQGMTVAALEAQCLQQCLRHGVDQLQRRYFRATAKPIGDAWQLATGGDLSLPEICGPRPVPIRMVNHYVKRVQAAARSDALVAQRLARVAGLMDAPSRLLSPPVASRVAVAALRRRRQAE